MEDGSRLDKAIDGPLSANTPAAGARVTTPAPHSLPPFIAPSDLLRAQPTRTLVSTPSTRPVSRDQPMTPLEKEQIEGLVSVPPLHIVISDGVDLAWCKDFFLARDASLEMRG